MARKVEPLTADECRKRGIPSLYQRVQAIAHHKESTDESTLEVMAIEGQWSSVSRIIHWMWDRIMTSGNTKQMSWTHSSAIAAKWS